ncbi:hypothetical protein BGX23_007341 [Mortierella sp. AD031]|nr:hypothetical protein BGX23_007341 [Mortierella sp. AD031]
MITPCEMTDCERPCVVVRKNKVLPPPTLSPLLPATISNPASLSPTATGSSPVSPTLSSASSSLSSSGYSDEEDSEESSLSHAPAWPRMDQLFFPDHCCRTSACRPAPASTLNNNNNGKGKNNRKNNNNNKKKEFMSELPPPPNNRHLNHRHDENGEGCMALRASIWGVGWHQVEPLPASFVKTLQAIQAPA